MDKVELRAYHAIQESLEPREPSDIPPITLDSLLKQYQDPVDIVEKINLYEPEKCIMGQFIGWLMKLQELLQDMSDQPLSTLIINDQTELSIPWEMLTLPYKETLGVILQVIRWQSFKNLARKVEGLPSNQPKQYYCSGTSFFCKEFSKQKQQICQIQEFLPSKLNPYADPGEFLIRLQTAKSRVGLIFLDSYRLHDLPIDRIHTYLRTSKLLESSDSIVIMSDSYKGDDTSRLKTTEIMKLFFRYGVKGIIRTASDCTHEFAVTRHFLRQCKVSPHLSNAEMLRKLRRKANDTFGKNPTDPTMCAKYLAVFTHMYYGQPLTFIYPQPMEGKR